VKVPLEKGIGAAYGKLGIVEPWHWALILKPFGLLVLFCAVALMVYPLRRWLPEGRLKRFLFFSWKV
jgi:hypothetical protein